MELDQLIKTWERCTTCEWTSTIAPIAQWMEHAEQCDIHKRNQVRQKEWADKYYNNKNTQQWEKH